MSVMKRGLFVPAAGLGSRLGERTKDRPKALVEFGSKPLIEHVLEKAERAGFTEAVINVHYMADVLEDYLRRREGGDVASGADAVKPLHCRISDERACLMDTGGALTHALPLLENYDYVVAHNADVLSNIDLSRLCADFEALGADALLVLQQRKSDRRLVISPQDARLMGRLNLKTETYEPASGVEACPLAEALPCSYAYNGIHVLRTSLIKAWCEMYEDQPFGLIEGYLRLASRFRIIGYFPPAPFSWRDMGKPEAFDTPFEG